jgi:hypothetical protein
MAILTTIGIVAGWIIAVVYAAVFYVCYAALWIAAFVALPLCRRVLFPIIWQILKGLFMAIGSIIGGIIGLAYRMGGEMWTKVKAFGASVLAFCTSWFEQQEEEIDRARVAAAQAVVEPGGAIPVADKVALAEYDERLQQQKERLQDVRERTLEQIGREVSDPANQEELDRDIRQVNISPYLMSPSEYERSGFKTIVQYQKAMYAEVLQEREGYSEGEADLRADTEETEILYGVVAALDGMDEKIQVSEAELRARLGRMSDQASATQKKLSATMLQSMEEVKNELSQLDGKDQRAREIVSELRRKAGTLPHQVVEEQIEAMKKIAGKLNTDLDAKPKELREKIRELRKKGEESESFKKLRSAWERYRDRVNPLKEKEGAEK